MRPRGKTEAVLTPSGQALYIRTPTAGYGARPLRRCTRCGGEVVWHERKGGGYTLVEVVTYQGQYSENTTRWYAPWIKHQCGKERLAELEQRIEEIGYGSAWQVHAREPLEAELRALRYELASPEEQREMIRCAEEERSERLYASSYGLGL